MTIDLTGKSWAHKLRGEMTVTELRDVADTYYATGCELDRNVADSYRREWERRHNLTHPDDEEEE